MSVTNITSTSVELIWEEIPEMNQNGIITGYQLRFRAQTSDNTSWTYVMIPGSNLTASLRGLQEFVTYLIQISGVTAAGTGPFSPELSITTLEDGKASIYHLKLKLHFFLYCSSCSTTSRSHSYVSQFNKLESDLGAPIIFC